MVKKVKNKTILILCNHKIVLYNFKKELVESLVKDGYDVYISMPFGDSLSYFKEVLNCKCIETNIDRRGINPIKDLKLVFIYLKLCIKVKPNQIFSLTIKPTIYGGFIAKLLKIKFVCNITGIGSAFQSNNYLKRIIVFMYKIAIRKCKMCFFENNENRSTFLDLGIIDEKNSLVVSGAGVNLDKFPYVSMEKHDRVIFTFVGRIMKEKGIEEFLYAVNKLQNSKVEFRVYGFCEDDYIEKLNAFNKLENFNYYGFTNDMKDVYAEADVIVLPSYHEGMSNVLLEAAATGRAIITSDIPGCKETVINNKSGFLVPVMDEKKLYDAMNKYITLDYNIRLQMSLVAREHMEKNFNRIEVNRKYLNAFK